jgi:hypothetical protein
MRGRGHSVSKAAIDHEVISCMERDFMQLLGRRFDTVKHSDD